MLGLAVLALHAATLGGVEWAWPERAAQPLPATLQVRLVDDAPAPPALAPPSAAAIAAEPAAHHDLAVNDAPAAHADPVKTVRAAPRTRVAAAPPSDAPPRSAEAAALVALPAPEAAPPTVPPAPAPVLLASLTAPAEPAASEAAGGADEAIPHYRTKLPPAVTLNYELQRGILRGTGVLSWRPQGEQYELRLDGRVGALPVITQISTGRFDAAGVAPLRFTDSRLSRAPTAANFQRDAGKVTFSGSSREYALREGTQDRLSWMLQLAAIVAGEPRLRSAGAKVAMFVVGARGEGGVWVLRCVGPEAIETPQGSVDAIKYVRDPRDPNDTTVQVWLDPTRHDLPVRATQRSGPHDESFELHLQSLVATP